MMKNLFKNLTFTTLLGLFVSLVLMSCGDGVKEAYDAEVSKADVLFQKKEYVDAKAVYLKASSIKKDEVYPREQITKIEDLLSKRQEDVEEVSNIPNVEVEKGLVESSSSKPFHIIVGSFSIQNNALGYQKELSSKGQQSLILRSREGNYLVSIHSWETLTKAYNYLAANKETLNEASWVYRVK